MMELLGFALAGVFTILFGGWMWALFWIWADDELNFVIDPPSSLYGHKQDGGDKHGI